MPEVLVFQDYAARVQDRQTRREAYHAQLDDFLQHLLGVHVPREICEEAIGDTFSAAVLHALRLMSVPLNGDETERHWTQGRSLPNVTVLQSAREYYFIAASSRQHGEGSCAHFVRRTDGVWLLDWQREQRPDEVKERQHALGRPVKRINFRSTRPTGDGHHAKAA